MNTTPYTTYLVRPLGVIVLIPAEAEAGQRLVVEGEVGPDLLQAG